ncbi:MAG: S8/S53 family peptidase [Acidimicrobiales bacterium]
MNYPTASRYAVSVGGTVLYSNATKTQRALEYAWSYTGGGSSAFISEPAFQKMLPPGKITQACAVNYAGQPYPPGTLCRAVPDIAAISGDIISNGYYTNFDMQPSSSGGTSLSSPLTMGMWTRVQAAAPPGGLGFANWTIYKLGTGKTAAQDFYDITTGSNGQHAATPGWDEVSGFGVMNVANFMKDATGRLTPTNPVTPPPVPDQPVAKSCQPVFTTPYGNATDPVTGVEDPTLDLTSGTITTSGKNLVVTLQGPQLAPTMPTSAAYGGTDYYMLWTMLNAKGLNAKGLNAKGLNAKGQPTTYYAHAHVAPSGTVTYSDGTAQQYSYTDAHTDTGSFVTGKLTINVPLANVGNPAVGTRLMYRSPNHQQTSH